MNDTMLTQGVLSRLDVVTAKLGVAASEVWNIWLATSWRPALAVAFYLPIGVLLLYIGARSMQKASDAEYGSGHEAVYGIAGLVGVVGGGILVVVAIVTLPDAVSYLVDPRLYAIDQLAGLLNK